MARAKSNRRRPELRRLYFSIDRSERSYWFGINHTNRHIWSLAESLGRGEFKGTGMSLTILTWARASRT